MSAAAVSVVYVTHRLEPRFEWFADSLAGQLGADGAEGAVEVIVVDARCSAERTRAFTELVGGRFAVRHVAPKPTPYNGAHRRTARPYSSASSARNTGIVYASAPYVVFVDDSCVLADTWWTEVRTAASLGYVLAGTYENRLGVLVEDGRIVGEETPGAGAGAGGAARDSRWALGDEQALVQIVGSQVFGCGLGVPRATLVALNGFDELCDPIGGEDTHLGVRLESSGERIFFSRRMMVVKDGERHRGDAVVRLDRAAAADGPFDRARYMACLQDFGVAARTIVDGAWNCSHLCLDILYGTRQVRSLGNDYDLADLTERDLAGLAERLPERYWVTGEALAEL